MRRATTALLAITVATVAVALFLRFTGDPGEPTTTTEAGTSSSIGAADTTSGPDPTTSSTVPLTSTTRLPDGEEACDLYTTIDVTGTVQSTDLVEASGLAKSRTQGDVLWAHNDSRGGPALYAFTSAGADLGHFEIPDAFALDWEDMAAGPGADGTGAYLYVGDIGDNFGIRRGEVTVWQVPDVDPGSLDNAFPTAQAFVYRMPDGAHDAEALFVDPVDPALFVITKSKSEAFVYRGELESAGEPQEMELVATLFLDAEVTAADTSPDGQLIVLRGYESVWMWQRQPGMTIADALAGPPCLAPSPDERQGEGITVDATWSYYTVSEGSNPDINFVGSG